MQRRSDRIASQRATGRAVPYQQAAGIPNAAQLQAFAAYVQAQQMFGPPPFVMPMAAPAGAASGAPEEQDIMATLPKDTIKVSKTTEAKALAGKLAHACRKGDCPAVVARGAAINTAVKGIAMACSFLKDLRKDQDTSVTLSCQCYHGHDGDNTTGRSVVFRITKVPVTLPQPVTTTLKVGKNSKPATVAGSLAAKIRQKESVAMEGVGPAAIEHATNALVLSRRYLKDNKLDITFTPAFVNVDFGGKTSSGMKWTITSVEKKSR